MPTWLPDISSETSFRVESAVSVRVAKSFHELPSVVHADSCALVHNDSDVNPGPRHNEADRHCLT
eukprot:1633942-Pyramimonas_sp.AAC.1